MYISRRVDIIGPPVWKSTISPHLSKSELASLRLWQSKCQQHTLSPLHHHTLTLPRYLTAPSHTRNPSDVERDNVCMHPFWFSPSTCAAIGPQTHLAHPPSIPWPSAPTPTPLQSPLRPFFAVSPVT